MILNYLLIIFFIILFIRSFLKSFFKNPFSVIEGNTTLSNTNEDDKTEVPLKQSGTLKSIYNDLKKVNVMKLSDTLAGLDTRIARLANKNYPAIYESREKHYEIH